MAITLEYQDEYGKSITEQQFNQLANKNLVYRENGILVKDEEYVNNELLVTEYYIPVGTDHNTVLATDDSCGITEFEFINQYRKDLSFMYRNGILIGKSIFVSNSANETLFSVQIDLNTNLPIQNTLRKYYIDHVHKVEYEFHYNVDHGKLSFILVFELLTLDSYMLRPSEISSIPNFESWEEHSAYYLNVSPMIPV